MKVILKKALNKIFFLYFLARFAKYRRRKKIIYALTPPANLRNVGDHAQALAIHAWLKDNFPGILVLEFNKDEVYRYIDGLKTIANKNDLIFLHSGGNLGDRGRWSEGARRLIIKNFPENKIISLPQTIFFSGSERGRKELAITKDIYNHHPDLTIMARDQESFRLAQQYFPCCKTMLVPDFVLYLSKEVVQPGLKSKGVLCCLRCDPESVLSQSAKEAIAKHIQASGQKCVFYDTTLSRDIPASRREEELNKALALFAQYKLVITDRFHGVIFSVVAKTPCIVLPTVDHKLRESVKWFKDLPYVVYVEDIAKLKQYIEKTLSVVPSENIDWRGLYFNSLKGKLGCII